MSCPQCQGIEEFFDAKEAARDLKAYRKKGPAKTTRMLLDAIKGAGVEGHTLLDIGGGVGALHQGLLDAGAASVVDVDASSAYIDAAGEEAGRRGRADRVRYLCGDFVDLAPSVEPADVVTLDRVICCYHDVGRLVGLSAERAGKLYGLVFPRDSWPVRAGFKMVNLLFWLRRRPFRIFVHSTDAVDSQLRSSGLTRRSYRRTLMWQVMLYGR